MFDNYRDDLWDGPVPLDALKWFALNGTSDETYQIASRTDLPESIALILVERGSARDREALTFNSSTPEQVIKQLDGLDEADHDRLSAHPNAPTDLMLQCRFERLTGLALANFLRKIRASDEEREHLLRVGSTTGRNKTLADLWLTVRSET